MEYTVSALYFYHNNTEIIPNVERNWLQAFNKCLIIKCGTIQIKNYFKYDRSSHRSWDNSAGLNMWVPKIIITILDFALVYNPMNPYPWESNSRSASQEIPNLLWNQKVHYRVHNSPQLKPVMSQMNSVHTLITYSRSILILSCHLSNDLPSDRFSSRVTINIVYAHLISFDPARNRNITILKSRKSVFILNTQPKKKQNLQCKKISTVIIIHVLIHYTK
jgi:hypothetical protein